MTTRAEPAVHVYCGPTITAAEVRGIIPGATVHRPVRHGDLLRLAAAPGDTVVIIDGVFHAVAAVRHKEILDLLASGVRVLGAASMGALRAAELYPYGMTGIGDIFAAYRDGIIEADDEVAVAHTEDGKQLSEALADIRALAAAAVTDDVLDRDEAERIVGLARGIHYIDRTWPALRKAASTNPEAEALLERLDAWRVARGPAETAKHEDAVAALRLVADGKQPLPAAGDWTNGSWHTFYLRHWIARYRGSVRNGIHVPYLAALQHQQIYDPGFPERWRHHVLSWIADLLDPAGQAAASDHDGEPDAEARALALAGARGFAVRHLSPDQLAYWLTDDELAILTGTGKLACLLVRSVSRDPSAAVWPTASGDAPGLINSAIDSPGAVAAAFRRNDEVAHSGPGRTIFELRPNLLRRHLGDLWGADPEDERALTAAARDRGFYEITGAVEAVRLFFLAGSSGPQHTPSPDTGDGRAYQGFPGRYMPLLPAWHLD
jgi:hypothetical protein